MLRFILLFIPFAAQAAESVSTGISIASYVQAALALALIVSLLAGTAWLARKVSGGKGFGQGGLKIVGGIALSPRERIVLLEVGEELLVIGIVPGQIRTLHRLAKGSLPHDALATPTDKPFAQWLSTIAERRSHE